MITQSLALPSPDYRAELRQIKRHTARAMSWSVAAHMALLVWLILHRTVLNDMPPLVEISWLEPEPVVVAAAPPQATQIATPTQLQPSFNPPQEKQKFERAANMASLEPTPQRSDALEDRLDALQSSLRTSRPSLAVSAPSSGVPTRATISSAPSTLKAPATLGRSQSGPPKVAPAQLTRSTSGAKPQLAVAPTREAETRAPAIATPDENSAQRTLDGAQIMGPVADRPVLSYQLPEYPAWAMREAVEASVTLYFVVMASGQVKDNVLVQKTSGHSDFDRNAQTALRAWRFEALSGAGEQWGTITFHFKLRDR
jgi:TonB family protein